MLQLMLSYLFKLLSVEGQLVLLDPKVELERK